MLRLVVIWSEALICSCQWIADFPQLAITQSTKICFKFSSEFLLAQFCHDFLRYLVYELVDIIVDVAAEVSAVAQWLKCEIRLFNQINNCRSRYNNQAISDSCLQIC